MASVFGFFFIFIEKLTARAIWALPIQAIFNYIIIKSSNSLIMILESYATVFIGQVHIDGYLVK